MTAARPAPPLVIDASAAVWLVLPVVAPVDVTARFAQWAREGRDLLAPALWLAETTSAIRRAASLRNLSAERGRTAIEDLLALGVDVLPMTADHCRAAYRWAERLGQARAYDGFFLALAEERGAELWTADQRLAHASTQLGVTWVHWIAEPEKPIPSEETR
jgi:predicted nucleic acid-binding protein